jgi:4-amino-4-deoxy-L-arabinose transferase-like glycosyltransferase
MKKVLLILVSALTPVFAFAQTPNFGYVSSGVGQLYVLATTYVIPSLMLLATAYFIWGVYQYIKAAPDKKKDYRKNLTSGIIALAVIVSAWGIIRVLQNVAGVNPSSQTNLICPPGYTPFNGYCRP